jgi:hypothetical protein
MIAGYMPISTRQRLRHSGGWQTFGMVVLMLAVASIPLTVAYGALADHQSLKVEWAIDGPTCPVVSQTERYHRPPQAFSYQGVHFTRQYGNVFCVVVPDGGVFSSAHHTGLPVQRASGDQRHDRRPQHSLRAGGSDARPP